MKAWSRALAALALALSLILSCKPNGAQADARRLLKVSSAAVSSSTITVPSSQALKGLQAHSKKPYKQVDTNFRRIPPSISNPARQQNCVIKQKQQQMIPFNEQAKSKNINGISFPSVLGDAASDTMVSLGNRLHTLNQTTAFKATQNDLKASRATNRNGLVSTEANWNNKHPYC